MLTEENLFTSVNFETGKVNWRRISFDVNTIFAVNKILFTITNKNEIFAWNEDGYLHWNQILPLNTTKFLDYSSNSDSLHLIFENSAYFINFVDGQYKEAPLNIKFEPHKQHIITIDEKTNSIHYESNHLTLDKISSPIQRAFLGDCKEKICKCIVTLKDGSILFIKNEKIILTKDESLASIIQTEMIDFVSEKKKEFVELSFFQRITLQILWFKNLLNSQKQTSDKLGLNKTILVLTKFGKLFGISSSNGNILWSKYYEGLIRIYFFNNQIYGVLKSSIIELNTDGEIIETSIVGEIKNSYLSKQGIILETNNGYSIFPKQSNFKINYFKVSDHDVYGYILENGKEKIEWRMNFNATIISNQRVSNSKVYSQLKVFGDFNTHIKKLNENMFAISTQDLTGKNPILTIYLIDGEKGEVIDSFTHYNARGPIKIILDENFLAYHFENSKTKKYQITTHELFYENRYSQSFNLPIAVKIISTTKTNKGITSKMFLFGLENDKILGIPKNILDPRRPLGPPSTGDQEEFLNTYEPNIPIIGTSFVTYNQTIYNLRQIDTYPTTLESSCHVIAYGTDLFYTRVAPSLSFDYLNDDFSYSLLLATCFGLLCVTLIARWYSRQIEIKRKWN